VIPAPSPALGSYAPDFSKVAETFASQLRSGAEIGAAVTVYHRGRCVVDLWGGRADIERGLPWQSDTRVVLFSVTKGLAAMAPSRSERSSITAPDWLRSTSSSGWTTA
jgi:CubicO group peptidase (beta-lactamase class C family)